METKETKMNIILGDVSLETADLSEHEKITSHLKYVEGLLRAGTNTKGTEERATNIQLLTQYWNNGIFPIGEHEEAVARKPNFRDSRGNLCAVGYLIQQSAYGGEELVDKITQKHQFSYLFDMDLPELVVWQERSGLSMRELAMIQPTYEFYITPARAALAILSKILTVAPGSDEEKSLLQQLGPHMETLKSYKESGGATGVAMRFKPELDEWEQKNKGKRQVVDDALAEVKEVVKYYLNPVYFTIDEETGEMTRVDPNVHG